MYLIETTVSPQAAAGLFAMLRASRQAGVGAVAPVVSARNLGDEVQVQVVVPGVDAARAVGREMRSDAIMAASAGVASGLTPGRSPLAAPTLSAVISAQAFNEPSRALTPAGVPILVDVRI